MVWAALQRPATLIAVSRPLLVFRPVDPPSLPDTWHEGDWRVTMRFLGLLPLGQQTIAVRFERSEGDKRVLRDDGHGALVRRWDHRITIAPAEDGRTLYRDEVTIDAGWLTPVVALFARAFYAHRQRRWHALIAARALPGQTRNGPA
jgi:ligand-binding SRPBCC domain-containing protein